MKNLVGKKKTKHKERGHFGRRRKGEEQVSA